MVDIVIWSGGYDSTLILDRLCSGRDKTVWAFAVDWDAVDELKRQQERIARTDYLDYAQKRGYVLHYREINVTANMQPLYKGLGQVIAWFGFTAPYLPENTNLHFGYHRGDDFWWYQRDAEQQMKSACMVGDRSVSFYYPLQFMHKFEIVDEFQNRGIPVSCSWTCEKPVSKHDKILPCGKCEPCTILKLAQYERDLRKDQL